jgi:hypothetical protein
MQSPRQPAARKTRARGRRPAGLCRVPGRSERARRLPVAPAEAVEPAITPLWLTPCAISAPDCGSRWGGLRAGGVIGAVVHPADDAWRAEHQADSYQRVADGEHDGWLLPGRKRGTHITAEHLRKRLAPHGITSRPGRHGALLALAGRLPAPILAERLGIHQARAAQWARAAGATYAPYVRLRAERSARHG